MISNPNLSYIIIITLKIKMNLFYQLFLVESRINNIAEPCKQVNLLKGFSI